MKNNVCTPGKLCINDQFQYPVSRPLMRIQIAWILVAGVIRWIQSHHKLFRSHNFIHQEKPEELKLCL